MDMERKCPPQDAVVSSCITQRPRNAQNIAGTERRSANYKPSIWSHDFLESLGPNSSIMALNKSRAGKLEQKVRCMINDGEAEPLILLELIDDIERLGLRYRFQNDINQALITINQATEEYFDVKMDVISLHATALSFRLLRHHGYRVSPDMFRRFKDDNGNFMERLCSDAKGLLSLYEASYHGFEGENILDEAKEFTRKHLREIKGKLEASMAEQVSHSLELPLCRRMQRLEARWYIEAYTKRRDANQILLDLAKLDFNIVQSTLQMDLQDVSRWWKNMGLADKLSFCRDRVTECFFSAVGIVFEPQFSYCRLGLTKVMALLSTLDDIYDVYGSLDELELFTDVVERWDINAVEILPQYMRVFVLSLYNTINEIAYHAIKNQQDFNILPYQRKMWADLCKAFLLEAKWNSTKFTPTFEEYMGNAWVSSSGSVILFNAYLLIADNITKEAFVCLENYHGLLRWPSMLFRLHNDLVTSKAEIERGESSNSIRCCMQEFGLSEEGAYEYIRNLIDETWKRMNKERVSESLPFPKSFVELCYNFARTVQCVYEHGDGHGAPDTKMKTKIMSVIVEAIA